MGRQIYQTAHRPWRRKPRGSRRSRRAVTIGILVVIALSAVIRGWRIRDVEATGGVVVPNTEIRNVVLAALEGKTLGVVPRSSMLALRPQRIARALRERFAFGEARVRRRFPGVLEVSVREQPLAALVTFAGEARPMLLSAEGYVLAPAPEAIVAGNTLPPLQWNGPPVVAGGQLLPSERIRFLLEYWHILGQPDAAPFRPQRIVERSGPIPVFDIATASGTVITVAGGGAGEHERQIAKLRAVLREYAAPEARARIRSIDLRYGDRVYMQ